MTLESDAQAQWILQKGVLTAAQLQQALAQKNGAEDLCAVLQAWQWLTEAQVAHVRQEVAASAASKSPKIGSYELQEKLGEGVMGQVWRVQQAVTQRSLALKILLKSATREVNRERFRREARALAKLRHPNIVGVLDFGEHEEQPFMVMELVEGLSLDAVLSRQGAYDLDEGLAVCLQIAQALRECHSQGLAHRDLKPENVIMDQSHNPARPMLVDFGLVARDRNELSRAGGQSLTKSGDFLGTPLFMAPEALSGELKGNSPQALDVWAFGVLLYHLLTASYPFQGQSLGELYGAVVDGSPKALGSGRPAWLQRLYHACLEKDPELRPSMDEIVEGIRSRCFKEAAPRWPWFAAMVVLLGLVAGLGLAFKDRVKPAAGPAGPAESKPADDEKPDKSSSKSSSGFSSGQQALALEALQDRERWNELSADEQDWVIAEVLARLPHFEAEETRTYECAGQSHRIGSFRHRISGIVFHLIPGGEYQMGTSDLEAEQAYGRTVLKGVDEASILRELPAHRLAIPAFLLARHELSHNEYFRGRHGLAPLQHESDRPMSRLNYDQAQEWCRLADMRFRLPSEAEWEYACRAGSRTRYYWGERGPTDKALGWFSKQGQRRLHGQSLSLDFFNAFGLVNMLGNISELCADLPYKSYAHGPYDHKPMVNSNASVVVARGGNAWGGKMACRVTTRTWIGRRRRDSKFGLRVAMDLPDMSAPREVSVPPYLEVLRDVSRWQKFGAREKYALSMALEASLNKQSDGFRLLRVSRYRRNGRTFDIATFGHAKCWLVLHLIPGGKYLMGSKDLSLELKFLESQGLKLGPTRRRMLKRELPQHEVSIEPFLLGRFELSELEWTLGLGGAIPRPIKREHRYPKVGLDKVSLDRWFEAVGSGFRLPSDAEWEYACRAGSKTRFFWGESLTDIPAVYLENSGNRRHGPYESRHNYNAFGLVNMAGNVMELCADFARMSYAMGPNDQQPLPSQGQLYRVLRGGCYKHDVTALRSAAKSARIIEKVKTTLGFRVAVSLPARE